MLYQLIKRGARTKHVHKFKETPAFFWTFLKCRRLYFITIIIGLSANHIVDCSINQLENCHHQVCYFVQLTVLKRVTLYLDYTQS